MGTIGTLSQLVRSDQAFSYKMNVAFTSLPNNALDCSKLKQSANKKFKCDENGGNFSERVENTVGKGEIARYEQFLLFPQCFQKSCPAGMKNTGLFGKVSFKLWNSVHYPFAKQALVLHIYSTSLFENFVEKG